MRVLALLAHPDDELFCLGTLRKHVERGDTVMIAWTTHGERSSQFVQQPLEETCRIRQEHGSYVAEQIGASLHFFDMGDAQIEGSRSEALQVARLYASFRPDVVITWNEHDAHPDHRKTAALALDALTLARIPSLLNGGDGEDQSSLQNDTKVYHILPPWQFQSRPPLPLICVDISKQIDVVSKVFTFYQAIYKWPVSTDYARRVFAAFGIMTGVAYAEPFLVRVGGMPAWDFLR